MKTAIVIFFVSIFVLGCLSEDDMDPEDLEDQKIVGGKNATEGQCKFIASLRNELHLHYCGGTIISEKHIITAGHCIDFDKQWPRNVVVGTFSRTDMVTMYSVEKRVRHKWYNKLFELNNDIAMIKTTIPIVFNDFVNKADLPFFPVVPNTKLTACGWGAIDITASVPPDYLQIIETAAISNLECKEKNGNNMLLPTILCTETKIEEGVCEGDSGGPLSRDNTIHGIISYVMGGCGTGLPDGHTRILNFVLWILRQMKTL